MEVNLTQASFSALSDPTLTSSTLPISPSLIISLYIIIILSTPQAPTPSNPHPLALNAVQEHTVVKAKLHVKCARLVRTVLVVVLIALHVLLGKCLMSNLQCVVLALLESIVP